jgi:hypothetical protein
MLGRFLIMGKTNAATAKICYVTQSPTLSLPARSLAPANEKLTIETAPLLKAIRPLQQCATKIPRCCIQASSRRFDRSS